MTYTSVQLPKPNDEATFERLCETFCKIYFSDPEAHKLGGRGQAQYGIDIIANRDGDVSKIVGIQCKKLKEGRQLSETELKKEIVAALNYTPHITAYYVLTTGANSVELTRICQTESLSLKNSTGRNVPIYFWGWEKISELVQEKPALHRKFHPNYNPSIPKVEQHLEDIKDTVNSNATAALDISG